MTSAATQHLTHPIAGGDMDHAGEAAGALKACLAKLGVDPQTLRRIMVAAYEAEMNVVIHATSGHLHCRISEQAVEVRVSDRGPGIPDIAQAMQPGYSTAPARYREFGFGAGLGLPNIKQSSDHFDVQSTPGVGTEVRFTVFLPAAHERQQQAHAKRRTPVTTSAARCLAGMHCLRACPTQALRVRAGQPAINDERCIGCAECLRACGTAALDLTASLPRSEERARLTLVVPTHLLSQVWGRPPEALLAALGQLGFARVVPTWPWEQALQSALQRRATQQTGTLPVISPACPAVLELISAQFPSLLGSVAPYLDPLAAAARTVGCDPLAAVVLCPAHMTELSASVGSAVRTIDPRPLFKELLPLLSGTASTALPMAGDLASANASEPPALDSRAWLFASGLEGVSQVLTRLEYGQLGEVGVLELRACPGGCWGSPLLPEGRALASFAWKRDSSRAVAALANQPLAVAVERTAPLLPRPGQRLAPDMHGSMLLLRRMDELLKSLPGKDCSQCGAPTCRAFAEDVVRGLVSVEACTARSLGITDRPEPDNGEVHRAT